MFDSDIDDLKREKLEGDRTEPDDALPREDVHGNAIRRCGCDRPMVECDCGTWVCWPCELASDAGVECSCGERFCAKCSNWPTPDPRTGTLVCDCCAG